MRKNFWRRGIAASEMAVMAPVLVLLFFGTHDVAQVMQSSVRLERAARSGAQFAIANPQDLQGVRSAVLSAAPGLSNTIVPLPVQSCECGTTAVACTATCASGMIRIITVSATQRLTPLLLPNRTSGTGSAVVRLR